MSRETYCPTLIQRVRAVRDLPIYGEQAKKQWDDVARELDKDCQMMERLDRTGALEQNEDLQTNYVKALKYAEEVAKEVAEGEALALAVGGAPKRKSAKKSTLKRKAPKRKSTKKSSLKRKAPKRKH